VTTFVVKQSEASFEARFASPMFALLGPTVIDLHQNMFLSLRKHGLTLAIFAWNLGRRIFRERT
jgi:hypothetical protein